jgi:ribosomal protein S18 acetylase RimI-like enzyme
MRIRAFRLEDEVEVDALWRLVNPNAPPWTGANADVRRKLAVQRELFLVAEDDARVVGTTMAGYDGHRGWVYFVAVLPDFRGRGIGTALMREAERLLVALGCPKLNLQVRGTNRGVVAFYEKLGFAVEDEVSLGKRL